MHVKNSKAVVKEANRDRGLVVGDLVCAPTLLDDGAELFELAFRAEEGAELGGWRRKSVWSFVNDGK